MNEQKWWYELHGEQKGPITYIELLGLQQQGLLSSDNMVWAHGFANWVKIAELPQQATQPLSPAPPVLPPLDPYYQSEFQRISQSQETYKGRWNWWAFLFGPIWAFSKGLWAYGLIIVLVAMVLYTTNDTFYLLYTLGWGIVLGLRGTYFYYNLTHKKKQW